MTKICKKCGVEKPIEEFHRDSGLRDGRKNACVNCKLKSHAVWRDKNREVERGRSKKFREANPEESRRRVRKSELKVKYGLTFDAFEKLKTEQNNCCACCGVTFEDTPHIDHIHGRLPVVVRGLLCSKCNTGLGMFDDSPDALQKAIWYLLRTSR